MEEDTIYHKVTVPYTDAAPKGGETPFFLVILLLIFFPPAAWYIMWREKDYHRWFTYLIGLYGFVTLIISFIMRQFLYPLSNQIYSSVNIKQPIISPFSYIKFYIVLGVIEILIAVFLFFINRKYEKIPKYWLVLSLVVLIFISFLQPLTQIFLTFTAYNNLVEQAHIKQNILISPTP